MVYPLWLIDGGTELALDLNVYQITVSPTSSTAASVSVSVADDSDAVSFGYEVVPYSSSFTNSFTYSNSNPFNITGLNNNQQYKIQVRAHSSSSGAGTYGPSRATDFTIPKSSTDSGITTVTGTESQSGATPYKTDKNIYYNYYTGMWVDHPSKIVPYTSNPTSSSDSSGTTSTNSSTSTDSTTTKTTVESIRQLLDKSTKSFLKLSNDVSDKDNYTVSYKAFPKLNTSKTYYVFGTAMFFEASIDRPIQSGGLGFFVDSLGKDGYFINIQTTASSAIANQNEFTIYKIKGGKSYPLPDSQSGGTTKRLTGVYGGKIYKLDVKVEVSASKVDIAAYINGFKITATDNNPTASQKEKGAIEILPITNKVALRCQDGVIYFDYVYGMHLNQDQFKKDQLFNLYQGQFSDATFSFLYGNTLLENQSVSSSEVGGFLEEFGPVAREIKYLNTRYESAPAFPLYTSVGINPFAQVIGERLTSFNAKVFVVNNTGTSVPLDDSNTYSFFIVGKYIKQSATIEYVDNYASEFDVQEPVQFESMWLQKQSDVKALGDWIKNIWSKKNMVIEMDVFGNPLISVGDIVTINYPYNDLYHTGANMRKFVITKVTHKFEEGLETSIMARTL